MLQRAVQSVLNQTWKNLEIIIADDASDEEYHQPLTKLIQAHAEIIKLLRSKNRIGAAACRNVAIKHASGDFVAGMDDDDFWIPNRIEKLIKEFDDNCSAVCSDDKMDYGSRVITWKKKPVITLDDLLFYNQAGNQVLTKKQYILEVGGYDESLPSAQDYDLWIRLAEKFGPIKNVPHVLQIINLRQDHKRISTSDVKAAGYIACFEKHKSKMNPEQVDYQQYRIRLASGEKVSWRELFKLVPSKLLKKEITRKLFL